MRGVIGKEVTKVVSVLSEEDREDVCSEDGKMNSQSRKDRQCRGVVLKEKLREELRGLRKEMEVVPGANVKIAPLSVIAFTKIKLIRASGACKQSLRMNIAE